MRFRSELIKNYIFHDDSFEHCSSNPLLAVPSSVVRNIAPICPDISPPTSAELHYLWVAALLRQFLRSVSWNGMTIADRKSTRLNSSHYCASRMPSSDYIKKTKDT